MLKNIPLYNPLPSGNFLPSRNGTLRFAGFHLFQPKRAAPRLWVCSSV